MKGWIYNLHKTQLMEDAVRRGVDTSGTLDDIRRRMSEYVEEHPEEFGAQGDEPTTAANTPPRTVPPTHTATPAPPTSSEVLCQMRKWGCHFDGRDPFDFLERLEELKAGHRYPETSMLLGLPELLRGDALRWCRNTRHRWQTWGDFERAFRAQFLPRRYQAVLRRETADRRQQPGEKFKKYVADILTLMRRAGGFTPEEEYERVYQNMRPEIKRLITYDEAGVVDDLQARATELEEIDEQCAAEQTHRRPEASKSIVAAAYNREECCWRCKQRGHTRFNCKRPPRKFCSRCGKDGVLTQQCHPPAGNDERAGATTSAARTPSPASDSRRGRTYASK